MALDEPTNEDEVVQTEKFRLTASRSLLEENGGIFIDYLTGPLRRGFQIKSKSVKSECGGSCSC